MERVDGFIRRVSKYADLAAGFGLVVIMILMVSNILLKNIFKKPIVGTYEYVGFLTCVSVSLALAHCAYKDFHISVGIFVDKLNKGIKQIIETITKLLIFIMMILFSYNIIQYASRIKASNQVSLTTKMPVHIFIYTAGIGIFLLSLVVLLQAISNMVKAVKK